MLNLGFEPGIHNEWLIRVVDQTEIFDVVLDRTTKSGNEFTGRISTDMNPSSSKKTVLLLPVSMLRIFKIDLAIYFWIFHLCVLWDYMYSDSGGLLSRVVFTCCF